MTPRYVIVLEFSEDSRTEIDFAYADDLHALVEARRLFMQQLMVNEARPLSLVLGRRTDDGRIDWLERWRSAAPPGSGRGPEDGPRSEE